MQLLAPIQRCCAPLLFMVFDYFAILSAEKMAFLSHGLYGCLPVAFCKIVNTDAIFCLPLIFLLFLSILQTYTKMQPLLAIVRQIFYAIFYALVAFVIVLYLMQESVLALRLYVILFGTLVFLNVYVSRYIIMKLLKTMRWFQKPVILIGAGNKAEQAMAFWERDLGYRYRVIGILDDAPTSKILLQQNLWLGTLENAAEIIHDTGIKTVVIAMPDIELFRLAQLVAQIQPLVRDISFVPPFMQLPLANAKMESSFTENIYMLHICNNLSRRRNRWAKRLFDLIATIGGSLLIAPVLLLLAIIVGIDNKGRIIFAHRRVGRNGKLFPCYKFQSMVPNAQSRLEEYLAKNPEARKEWEESFKLTNDPRVTKLGAILRKTSLDELPQLWNVLMGDMSLVGPRPIVTKEIERYGDYIREYYMVPPGITGMWQVNGRSDTTYEERVAMDTWYVRNWSVWIDLVYLFKTVKTVFTGKGAY